MMEQYEEAETALRLDFSDKAATKESMGISMTLDGLVLPDI